MTVAELRRKLNELIAEGYGDSKLYFETPFATHELHNVRLNDNDTVTVH